MAERTLSNDERGCGHLKRDKAYIRGVIGSPDGVLPSFTTAEPFVKFREHGLDGGFTRGFQRFDGLTAQLAFEDIADFIPHYPGESTDAEAVENLVKAGVYDDEDAVPDIQTQRHVDRIRSMDTDGDHFGEVGAARQSDLLMRAGKTHYPDPQDFIDEAIERGISKAIPLSQRQEPPVIEPGVTRCWIVHPDTDRGWAVIGYAYLQEVVYTEPADGAVPQYVQEYAAADRLDIVDIEPAPDADDQGPDAQLDQFDEYPDGSDGDDSADTVVPSDKPGRDVEAADDGEQRVLANRWATWYDEQDAGERYNLLKRIAANADASPGPQPSADELFDALAAAGVSPDDQTFGTQNDD